MNLSLLNKKVVALIILAGLVPVLLGVMAIRQSQLKAVKTVFLANGKQLAIDQSLESVKKELGNNIREVRSGIYRYPADPKLPAQVNLYMEKNKLAGVLIGRSSHRQVKASLGLGMTGTRLSGVFGAQLKAIDTAKEAIKQRGYKVSSMGIVSYYITSTCAGLNGDQIDYLAVVKQGSEKRISFLNQPRKCPTPVAAQAK